MDLEETVTSFWRDPHHLRTVFVPWIADCVQEEYGVPMSLFNLTLYTSGSFQNINSKHYESYTI